MPSVKKVKLSDAPRVVKTPLAKRGLEYDGYVNSVGAGEALRFELGSGETVRAIRSRLYAAARRMEKDIDVWDVDGVVYCALK